MLTAADVQRSFHYLFPDELPALKLLVAQLPPDPLVINIGAGSGTSGLAILETRPDVAMITIDITDLSSPHGCLEAERDVVARAGLGGRWGKYWRQIKGDSVQVGRNWGDMLRLLADNTRGEGMENFYKAPDMVFVDGDHSYEGAKGDIEVWFDLLKPGGIMAVHDYRKEDIAPNPNGPHPMPWPGVDSAVAELLLPNFPVALHVDSLIAFVKTAT